MCEGGRWCPLPPSTQRVKEYVEKIIIIVYVFQVVACILNPVSACYAEHYNKRISYCAHVWTKSKFLGLSIGVHNIGQGCISVLDYDEEYIVSFPNGYGR